MDILSISDVINKHHTRGWWKEDKDDRWIYEDKVIFIISEYSCVNCHNVNNGRIQDSGEQVEYLLTS